MTHEQQIDCWRGRLIQTMSALKNGGGTGHEVVRLGEIIDEMGSMTHEAMSEPSREPERVEASERERFEKWISSPPFERPIIGNRLERIMDADGYLHWIVKNKATVRPSKVIGLWWVCPENGMPTSGKTLEEAIDKQQSNEQSNR